MSVGFSLCVCGFFLSLCLWGFLCVSVGFFLCLCEFFSVSVAFSLCLCGFLCSVSVGFSLSLYLWVWCLDGKSGKEGRNLVEFFNNLFNTQSTRMVISGQEKSGPCCCIYDEEFNSSFGKVHSQCLL